LNVGIN